MTENEAKKICECLKNRKCQKSCRQHIDYPDEHNCALISAEINGSMSLREVAERMGISHIRVMQIEREAIAKLKAKMND